MAAVRRVAPGRRRTVGGTILTARISLKRLLLLSAMALAPLVLTAHSAGATTYVWVGGASAPWTTPTSWSPARTTPASGDVLQFNGGNRTVTAVPTQTIGQLA